MIRELTRLSTGLTQFEPGFLGLTTTLHRVTGEEAWVYSISLGGVMKMRFGLDIQGQYLVISNHPLTYRPRVMARHPAPNNGLHLEQQPAFDLKDNEAGLLPHVRELSVSLQFEQDGLRVISSWSP